MPIELSADAKKQALASLRRYCTEELEIEPSDIQIAMLLDFVLKEIAPSAHNAGLEAAEAFLRDRLADLEGACYEPEFAYWPKGASVRRKGKDDKDARQRRPPPARYSRGAFPTRGVSFWWAPRDIPGFPL
jgi:uncharacterized protein (DUF2164 family)